MENALISAQILALVAGGMPLREALDTVCGAGTFEKLAGDVYDTLRAQTSDTPAV